MKAFLVRLPDDLHEALRREAFEAQTSMASLVRQYLVTRGQEWKRAPRASEPFDKEAARARLSQAGLAHLASVFEERVERVETAARLIAARRTEKHTAVAAVKRIRDEKGNRL